LNSINFIIVFGEVIKAFNVFNSFCVQLVICFIVNQSVFQGSKSRSRGTGLDILSCESLSNNFILGFFLDLLSFNLSIGIFLDLLLNNFLSNLCYSLLFLLLNLGESLRESLLNKFVGHGINLSFILHDQIRRVHDEFILRNILSEVLYVLGSS